MTIQKAEIPHMQPQQKLNDVDSHVRAAGRKTHIQELEMNELFKSLVWGGCQKYN